jgi:hypothetical protein
MVVVGASDPVIEALVKADKTPWYRKPNLRTLYLFLVPCGMMIESTSGFDSSLMSVHASGPVPLLQVTDLTQDWSADLGFLAGKVW